MKIKVDREYLIQIADAVRNLPVQASNDFNAADSWVGIVIAIENMANSSEPCEPDKDETEKEE